MASVIKRTKGKTRAHRIRTRSVVASPGGNLSNFQPSDKTFDDDHLLNIVRSLDMSPELLRSGDDWLHLSSLVNGVCPRKEALAFLSDETRHRTPMAAERIVWALGRAAEHHVRTQFVNMRQLEGVLGQWRCSCGQVRHDGFYQGVGAVYCDNCNLDASIYGELTLKDSERLITGNPDLLFQRPDDLTNHVVEIKSMNKTQYDKLKRPLPEHVLQALGYQRLLTDDGRWPVDQTSVTIFYVCKDFAMKPYKEFRVELQTALTAQIDMFWSQAESIANWKRAHDSGQPLPLPAKLSCCETPTQPTPKGCSECVSCFAYG